MDASHPLMLENRRDEKWTLAGRRHQSANGEEQALHGQTGGNGMDTSHTLVRTSEGDSPRDGRQHQNSQIGGC